MSNSVSNRHLAPEIYAASRRMKGKSTETVVGDLTTKTFHDRQQQLNPHSVVGANLKKEAAKARFHVDSSLMSHLRNVLIQHFCH